MNHELSIQDALAEVQALQARGEWQAAEAVCRELVRRAPESVEAWLELGSLLLKLGRFQEAEGALRIAAARGPRSAAVWDGLGVALREQGRLKEAETCARQAVGLCGEGLAGDGLAGNQATAWLNLGSALYGQLRWQEAADAFRRSAELDPANSVAWSNLGAAEQVQNHLAAAEQAYERSLSLGTQELVTVANYSLVLASRGDAERARAVVQSVPEGAVQTANEWIALGNVHKALDDVASAAGAYRRALALAPAHPQAIQNLALVLESQHHYAEAEQCIGQILAGNPQSADAWSLLAGIKHAQGDHPGAIAASERSLALELHPVRHSRMLQFMQYAGDVEPAGLLAAHRRWDATYCEGLAPTRREDASLDTQHWRDASGTRLRLGFVSADFGMHPIAFLALPALEALDRSQCEVVCYSDRLIEDGYTARFRAASDTWRRTSGLSDEEVAEQVRSDQIDVLFDLAGHHGKRLLVFARQPAALLISWAGYVGTTGMRAMDDVIADRFHAREGDERFYSENVLRLPNGYACYGPPADAPDVGPLPALGTGRFTFGCFNNPGKYADRMFDAWAEILRRVTGSQLLLKFSGLDEPHNRERVLRQFAVRGLDAARIALEGWSPQRDLLASYGRVDLALDTQPYSGGLTTCEALWMGVPVVTFPGRTFAGRHSTSHLTNAGFAEFVAADAAGYVEQAVQWSSRLDELAAIRAQMRERVRQSPLCDAPRFARDFLAAVRHVWTAASPQSGR